MQRVLVVAVLAVGVAAAAVLAGEIRQRTGNDYAFDHCRCRHGAAADMMPLHRVSASPSAFLCYADNLTAEQWTNIQNETELLPPTLLGPGVSPRYFVSSICWVGAGNQGSTGQAAPAQLTVSFPADAVSWGFSGLFSGSGPAPNVLNANLTSTFGAGNLDLGREYIRQALAGWRRVSGLSYQEVADDNTGISQSTTHVTTRGDVRIGGIPMGTTLGVLAYNAFPNASGTGLGGSDMTFNTSFFLAANLANSANNYRYLRNTTSHEHGHGLSYIHATPCNGSKLMEPQIATGFDMQQFDEIRGAQRNYGDRFAGNNSAGSARDLGSLTTPTVRSVIATSLSTNGSAGPNGTNQDWFRFTLDSAQDVTITVTPTGGSYPNGQQTSGCSPTSPATVNAAQAGNLALDLRDSTGASVLLTSNNAAGLDETITALGLAPGNYTIRVIDAGPNPAGNQTLQTYNLTLRIGTSFAPPYPIAGINKRCTAYANCYFMGDISSRATDGATLPASGYQWDLDGDGSFEISGVPQPNRQYPSNGIYNVTLRLTDSNGSSATDSITVTVFGAATTVTGVAPSAGNQGQTVPVSIVGSNFKAVTSSSMVTVAGGGVTVTGVPGPNALGTQINGLSFVIAPGAAPGPRDVTISNSDGTGVGIAVFTIAVPCTTPSVDPILDASASCGTSYTSPSRSTNAGTPPITWSLAGSPPAGMTINSGNGVVSWPMPITTGSLYTISVTATNACGADTKSFQLAVNPNPPTIDPIAPASTACGVPFQFTPTSGAAGLTWSLSGAPAGMTINPGSGLITWPTPDQSGSPYTVSVNVNNVCGSDSKQLQLAVDPNPPSTIPIADTASVCSVAFNLNASASGGATPYSWSLNGSPPAGMTIDSNTGAISWPNPVVAGSPYTIVVQADSASGCGSSTEAFDLMVAQGDLNGDGVFSLLDIPPFVNQLVGQSPPILCAADVNGDGVVNGDDIPLFLVQLGI